MAKRILAGLFVALSMIGCGGGSGTGGTANALGVNADPNVGSVTISANGTSVLNNVGYGSASSGFVAVNTGTNAQIYVTNNVGTQLAGTTFLSGFTAGQYYAIFAYGGSTNQSVAVLPVDVTEPTSGASRLIFVNTSVYQPSVDVYVTTQTLPTGLNPNVKALSAFNSGFASEVNKITPGTYNVIFTQAGTMTVVATQANVTVGNVLAGTGANAITLVGMTDAPGSTVPALQQTITPIVLNAVAGAVVPKAGSRATIIHGLN